MLAALEHWPACLWSDVVIVPRLEASGPTPTRPFGDPAFSNAPQGRGGPETICRPRSLGKATSPEKQARWQPGNATIAIPTVGLTTRGPADSRARPQNAVLSMTRLALPTAADCVLCETRSRRFALRSENFASAAASSFPIALRPPTPLTRPRARRLPRRGCARIVGTAPSLRSGGLRAALADGKVARWGRGPRGALRHKRPNGGRSNERRVEHLVQR